MLYIAFNVADEKKFTLKNSALALLAKMCCISSHHVWERGREQLHLHMLHKWNTKCIMIENDINNSELNFIEQFSKSNVKSPEKMVAKKLTE